MTLDPNEASADQLLAPRNYKQMSCIHSTWDQETQRALPNCRLCGASNPYYDNKERPMEERFRDANLEEIFSYHKPTEDQLPKYEAIRSAALVVAKVLRDNTPGGADQIDAMRKLREVVMTANASIALGGRF